MDKKKPDTAGLWVWWWLMLVIAFLGVGIIATRKFGWFYNHSYLGWGTLITGILGLFAGWLWKEASEHKPHKHDIVSGRTKVAPGGVNYPTEVGKSRSEPERHDNWFTTVEPVQTGTAQAAVAKQPSMFTNVANWIATSDKMGVIMLYMISAAFFLVGTAFGIQAATADTMLGFATGALLCVAFGTMMFAAAMGKLGDFAAWWGKHLTLATFIGAIIAAFYFGRYAYEGAFIWHWDNWEWPHVGFILAIAVALGAALHMVDFLGDTLKGLGKGLAYLHFGKLSYTLSLIVWMCWIVGGSLFVALVTKSPVFDRLLYADVYGEALAIGNIAMTFGVGFFLFFGAIALDYRRFKK